MHYINCSKCGQGGILVEAGTTAVTCPTCDKVAAERERCIGIVQRKKIHCIMAITHEPAEPSPEIAAWNERLEEIISEIRGAN